MVELVQRHSRRRGRAHRGERATRLELPYRCLAYFIDSAPINTDRCAPLTINLLDGKRDTRSRLHHLLQTTDRHRRTGSPCQPESYPAEAARNLASDCPPLQSRAYAMRSARAAAQGELVARHGSNRSVAHATCASSS